MTRATNLLTILALTAFPVFPADRRILISIAGRKILLLEDGHVLKVYDIAAGKPSTPSPQGEFRIVNRIAKPAWYASGKVAPPGPRNPLGTRWLGLSAPGYGIHGTNSPGSIGKAASHGRVRMRNRDVEELFQLVEVGDAVEPRGPGAPWPR
ncbi:MAG: L,D-transpeptidase [Bryobacterales bacterium]|nr:L,D-transpeptidase [Bryobacterales bacterium]